MSDLSTSTALPPPCLLHEIPPEKIFICPGFCNADRNLDKGPRVSLLGKNRKSSFRPAKVLIPLFSERGKQNSGQLQKRGYAQNSTQPQGKARGQIRVSGQCTKTRHFLPKIPPSHRNTTNRANRKKLNSTRPSSPNEKKPTKKKHHRFSLSPAAMDSGGNTRKP